MLVCKEGVIFFFAWRDGVCRGGGARVGCQELVFYMAEIFGLKEVERVTRVHVVLVRRRMREV